MNTKLLINGKFEKGTSYSENIINPTNVIKATNEEIISDKFTLSLRRILYEDGEIIEFKN